MDHLDNPATAPERAPSPMEDAVDQERSKKIALLKQAVADGTYFVSAEQLAEKLIDHMLEPKG